jgi:cytochrome P450
MLEMIEDRKGSVLEERQDLMSNLIRASMEQSGARKGSDFTHRDLLGNIFIFLFAGHETTASALSFAIALLAIHQEEQEELYQHVRSVVPDGRLPTYQNVPQLTRVLAVIYETLRLFSPASWVTREAAEDCVITTDSGETVAVPKGTVLVPMIDAMHHNPKYWPDPYEFRPSRFLEDYNKDAFMPFSAGARVCIGRRFSEIEQIAVLSVIALNYKITILEEPQYAHETVDERKKRVLAQRSLLVVKPVRIPVVFTPREGANILA